MFWILLFLVLLLYSLNKPFMLIIMVVGFASAFFSGDSSFDLWHRSENKDEDDENAAS